MVKGERSSPVTRHGRNDCCCGLRSVRLWRFGPFRRYPRPRLVLLNRPGLSMPLLFTFDSSAGAFHRRALLLRALRAEGDIRRPLTDPALLAGSQIPLYQTVPAQLLHRFGPRSKPFPAHSSARSSGRVVSSRYSSVSFGNRSTKGMMMFP